MTDAEMRAEFGSLREGLADAVEELRLLRSRIERPVGEDDTARLVIALAGWLEPDADALPFTASEVFDAARDDAALSSALDALGLDDVDALGYWLRTQRDRNVAGFAIRRDGRTWRLERK